MKNKKFESFVGTVEVLIAGILWGCIGIFVRRFENELTSMQMVAARTVFTAVILFVILLIFKRSLLKIKLRDIWCFIGTGLCSIILFNYCYFKCLNETSMSVAAVLLYTAPAMVTLMSAIVFKEKITVPKISALLLAMLSCVLVSGIIGTTTVVSKEGLIAGVMSGLGYALYSIFSRAALNRGYKSLTIIFYTFFIALLFLIPFTDWRVMSDVMFNTKEDFLYYLMFSVISTVLPYIFYTYGLNKLSPSRASIMASVEPVSATVVGFLFFNEQLTASTFFAVACILVSIILLAVNSGDKKKLK